MTPNKFISLLRKEVSTYKSFLETDSQDWIVKGFIDIDKNVYTIAGIGEPHYHNLVTYKEYLKSQSDKLNKLK